MFKRMFPGVRSLQLLYHRNGVFCQYGLERYLALVSRQDGPFLLGVLGWRFRKVFFMSRALYEKSRAKCSHFDSNSKGKPIVQLDALCQLLPPSRFDDLLQTMDLDEMEENANSHSFEETLMIVNIQNGGVDVGGSNCAELQGSPLRYNSLRLSCILQLCNLVLQFWYASLRPPCMVCLHVLRSSLRPKHRYASR
jgi:hypothetical protein